MAKKVNPEPEKNQEVTDEKTTGNPEITERNPEKTEVFPKDSERLPAITIKKPRKTAVELFRKLTEGCENQTESFENLVQLAKTGAETIGKPKVDLTLLEAYFDPKEEKDLGDTLKNILTSYEMLLITLKQDDERIKALEAQLAEKPTEVTKEVEKKLDPGQVIITFTEKTAADIRKARPFIAKSNYLAYERGDHSAFINALVNKCVSRSLKIDWDHVINPL